MLTKNQQLNINITRPQSAPKYAPFIQFRRFSSACAQLTCYRRVLYMCNMLLLYMRAPGTRTCSDSQIASDCLRHKWNMHNPSSSSHSLWNKRRRRRTSSFRPCRRANPHTCHSNRPPYTFLIRMPTRMYSVCVCRIVLRTVQSGGFPVPSAPSLVRSRSCHRVYAIKNFCNWNADLRGLMRCSGTDFLYWTAVWSLLERNLGRTSARMRSSKPYRERSHTPLWRQCWLVSQLFKRTKAKSFEWH